MKLYFQFIKKRPGYSFVTLFSLVMGIAAVLIIGSWTLYHINYNSSIPNIDKVFSIVQEQHYSNNKSFRVWPTPPSLKTKLEGKHSEIEFIGRTTRFENKKSIRVNDKNLSIEVEFADKEYLQILGFEVLYGNINHFVGNSVILSKKDANRIFEKSNVVGETITIKDIDYNIAAVIEDTPPNIEHQSKAFININSNKELLSITSNCLLTLVKLNTTDYAGFEKRIKKSLGDNNLADVYLYPATKWHLYNIYLKPSLLNKIYLFATIGLVTLMLSLFNFINLSSARSNERHKEIGIRRVSGASKSAIQGTFIKETIYSIIICFALAYTLFYLVAPIISTYLNITIPLNIFTIEWIPIFVLIVTSIIVFGGYLPYRKLSQRNVVQIMQGEFKGGQKFTMRQFLIGLQYFVVILLLICTSFIFKQHKYLSEYDVGFNTDDLLVMELESNKLSLLKDKIEAINGVENISTASSLPNMIGWNGGGFSWNGNEDISETLISYQYSDKDYAKTIGIEMTEGVFFKHQINESSHNIVINQQLAKLIGNDDLIGKSIRNGSHEFTIVGICKDYSFSSARREIGPLIHFHDNSEASYFLIKTTGQDQLNIKNAIDKTYTNLTGKLALSYYLSDTKNDEYASEKTDAYLLTILAMWTIAIALMGVIGMSALIASKKTKEFGLRKINGASISSILILINKSFLFWVCLSAITAIPLAYVIISKWMNGFANKTSINWEVFAAVSLITILITIITISWNTFKVVRQNPIKALRYE